MTVSAYLAVSACSALAAYALYRHYVSARWIARVTAIMIDGCHNIEDAEAPRLARRFAQRWRMISDPLNAAQIIAGDQLELSVEFEAWDHFSWAGEFPDWFVTRES